MLQQSGSGQQNELIELLRQPLALSTADAGQQVELADAEVRVAEALLVAAGQALAASELEHASAELIYAAAKQAIDLQKTRTQISELEKQAAQAEADAQQIAVDEAAMDPVSAGLIVERAKLVLYRHPLSGNTHKVRLLLGFLALPFEEEAIDIPAGGGRSPDHLAINPLGQVPVLVDGALTLRDAQAILVYLGGRHSSGAWRSSGPAEQGLVMQWLSYAANEIQLGLSVARLHVLLGAPADLPTVQRAARGSLGTSIGTSPDATGLRPGDRRSRIAPARPMPR